MRSTPRSRQSQVFKREFFLDKPGITQRMSKQCVESGATQSCHSSRPAIPAPEQQSPQEKKVGRIPY
jgi:hypothetical protein